MYFFALNFGRSPSPLTPTETLQDYTHTTREMLTRAIDCENWDYVLNVLTLFPHQNYIIDVLENLARYNRSDDLVKILDSPYADKAEVNLINEFFFNVARNYWRVLKDPLLTKAAQYLTVETLEEILFAITLRDYESDSLVSLFTLSETSKISTEKLQAGFFNIIDSHETGFLRDYLQFTMVKAALKEVDIVKAYDIAVSKGHKDTAAQLREYASNNIPLDRPAPLLLDAARHNDLESVRHILTHYEIGYDQLALTIVEAAQYKHEKVLLLVLTRTPIDKVSTKKKINLVMAFFEAIIQESPTIVLIFKAFKITDLINNSVMEEIKPLLDTCNRPMLRRFKPLALVEIQHCRQHLRDLWY